MALEVSGLMATRPAPSWHHVFTLGASPSPAVLLVFQRRGKRRLQPPVLPAAPLNF